MINPPQDIQESHDGDTSLGKSLPIAIGLVDIARSISSSDSIKLVRERIEEGPKLASMLMVHADENKTISEVATPLVDHTDENNKGKLKSASPPPVVSTGESNKGEEKDELIDVVEDSGNVAGSNSKSIRISLDGDIQDDIKDAPTPPTNRCGGSNGKGGKSKDKDIVTEAGCAMHIWTERERRKKMNNMYNTLHSLLPRLPDKADKATIVGEAVDYIKTLEGTIERLEKLKVERVRAQQLVASCTISDAPRCTDVSFKGVNPDRYGQRLVRTASGNRCRERLHDAANSDMVCTEHHTATRFPENLMMPEDRYKLAASEILQLISK
ncbi:hypothetical protein PR202_ga20259 [Eleusine coracana subsp. coracana]|uniref:BHLH domain-containing protein n=1 Tax=Eleusine coracana subsp. coracana TaxID=191504 RepID=A0AAV5CXA2_ELECO|nr:hypothetical protein PR202_ga20259 [Eleusine coracana subsp. coracana]